MLRRPKGKLRAPPSRSQMICLTFQTRRFAAEHAKQPPFGIRGLPVPASIAFYRRASEDAESYMSITITPAASRRTIRRQQLREIVPLADSTIFEMEQRGEFPQRFYLTSRCVVWDLSEVEQWLDARRAASRAKSIKLAPTPDVRLRRAKPVTQ